MQSNDELIIELAQFTNDPYGFVMFNYPWGEKDSELADSAGPEPWQKDILKDLGKGLITISTAILLATTSGHGIGKSALVAWIIQWAMATFEDTKGVVTANTENQLKTKTWAELAKWHHISICKDLFRFSATKYCSADPEHAETWKIDMVPWSERNTEAFAGLHNKGKRILVIFDEGSGIPDIIWEVTEGALTDKNTQIIWAVFGNPTRNKGRFRECFEGGRFAHRWNFRRVDSREVSFTNKIQFEEWIHDYGEDSDFVRVRIKGVFPRVDAESFIPYELARAAALREVRGLPQDVVVLGVDPARFGDDPAIIYPRCGRDAVSRPVEVYPTISITDLAKKVIHAYQLYHAQFVFVDGGGVGGGLVDILRLAQVRVIEVDYGSGAEGTNLITKNVRYANKRAEIYGELRDWLEHGSIIEKIPGQEATLPDELSSATYSLNNKEAILLESKKSMRARGITFLNVSDALACTFALPIVAAAHMDIPTNKPTIAPDHNPLTIESIFA